ncbi:hypothetical protein BDV98DRAFT_132360 [Pterulicium gracile]|uniref:Uncharacterized protein n=1 Tax=Pterulicium gracile TaxID=1884261 RepID=A0A5C3QC87_9AGAR|nr:hypothetical protein BDV98DRAFT_132360 [Pterula gracilis]
MSGETRSTLEKPTRTTSNPSSSGKHTSAQPTRKRMDFARPKSLAGSSSTSGMTIDDTSFWSARVDLSEESKSGLPSDGSIPCGGFWDNSELNLISPLSDASPWPSRRSPIGGSSQYSGFWNKPR